MNTNATIENCVTLICATGLAAFLFWVSHSFHSLWVLLLLLNINYVKTK